MGPILSRQETSSSKTQKIQYYTAPLLDAATCPVMAMHESILEIIFKHLLLPELSNFAQTCRVFNDAIGEYLRHQCSSRNLLTKYKQFVTLNGTLLTSSEKMLLGTKITEKKRDMYKLLAFEHIYGSYCQRISVCDDKVHFPHRDNKEYMEKLSYDYLSDGLWVHQLREIVHVKSVCWLSIGCTFKSIKPGRYQVG